MRKKPTIKSLLLMAAKANEMEDIYSKHGLWRFARDSQLQRHVLRDIISKTMRKKKRRGK